MPSGRNGWGDPAGRSRQPLAGPVIGDTAAATKINLYFALNTLLSIGMPRVNGWTHDRWAPNGMLFTEALVGAVALAIFTLLARRVRGTELPAAG